MAVEKDFEFYVGSIEDAILELLENEMKPLGVKTFATYSGELSDPAKVKEAIGALSPKFPLVLVSYADGVDKQDPGLSPVFGESRVFRHDCTFVVICASADARGDFAQRRGKLVGSKKIGCYSMLSKVREVLTDLQIEAVCNGEKELLTYAPLVPAGNEFIARLPQITAYAVPFDTYFRWQSKDRREAGTAVEEFILEVESLNTSSGQDKNKPGVNIKT